MKLNPEQAALLEAVTVAQEEYLEAKTREREVAIQQANERIHAFKVKRDIAAARANMAGVPKSQIGKIGMGTSNPSTPADAIEAGLPLVASELTITPAQPVEMESQGTPRFQLADGALLITLQPEDFEPYAGMLAAGVPDEELSWEFDPNDLAPHLSNEDATWEHPVVQIVLNTPIRQQAASYVLSQLELAN